MLIRNGKHRYISMLGVTLVVAGAASMVAPPAVGAKTGAVGTGRPGKGHAHVVISPRTSSVTWTPVGPQDISGAAHGSTGGGAGKLQAFAVDLANPQVMYAGGGVGPGNSGPGSEAGVYASSNGGTTWSQKDSGLTDTSVTSLWLDQSNPSVLLAGTWDTGIFRTTDGGSSWSQVASFGATCAVVQGNTTLYAATAQGIAESTDSGATWSILEATSDPVRALAVSGSTLWAGLDNGNVMTAAEPANAWSNVYSDSGHTVWSVAADPNNAAHAFVVEFDNYQSGDMFVTSDGGSSWTAASLPGNPPAQVVVPSANATGTYYAGSDGGMYSSTDGGATWSEVSGTGDVRYLYSWPGRTGVVVAGTDQGLYETTNSGSSWTSLNANITSSIINDVAVNGAELLTTVQDYSPLESTDSGSTWSQPSGANCENGTVAINRANPSYQYLFTTCGGFAYSSNGGSSFTQVGALANEYTFEGQNNAIAVDPNSGSTVYVAGKSGVWKSTDWGVDFSLQSSWPASSSNTAAAIALSPANSSNMFLGTAQGLYTSNNGGSSWSAATGLPSGQQVLTIAIDPADTLVVLVATCCSGNDIFRSTNGGASFTSSAVGLPASALPNTTWPPGTYALSFDPGLSGVVVAAGVGSGLLASPNAGQSWVSAMGNAATQMFTGISWFGGNCWVSTFGEGVLETSASQIENVASSAPTQPPLSITTTSLGGGTQGNPYSATLSASGGTTPYTWALASGTLPTGLTLSPGGTISGTPTAAGASNFTVSVSDSSSPTQTVTQPESITVTQTPPPAPTVTAVTPLSGSTAGGTTVTVTGTNLTGATEVAFGPTAGTNLSCTSTQCSVTSPAETAGVVDVTVTTAGGTSAKTSADQFSYSTVSPPAPTVTSVSPSSGPTSGGTIVTITGTNLTGATGIDFGSIAGTNLSCTSTQCSVTSPGEAAGTIDVTATTPGGTSAKTAADQFTYLLGSSPVAVVTTSVAPATVGTTYSASLSASGGTTPYTWSLASGTLPTGLTLSPGGTISGAPTAAGTSNFTVSVSDSSSPAKTAARALSITVTSVPPSPVSSPGYWMLGWDGSVYPFGSARSYGAPSTGLPYEPPPTLPPYVAIASTPDGLGYWILSCTKGACPVVDNYGDAGSFSLSTSSDLSFPVAIATTADGKGYWVASADGQVLLAGDAVDFGSPKEQGLKLAGDIVNMVATPDGKGYWMLGSDGGVFTYGDAEFYGSTGNMKLDKPAVAMAPTHDGKGYWFVAADGGIFSFGDATFHGSTGQLNPSLPLGGTNSIVAALVKPVNGMVVTSDGGGYWLVASDGGVFTFGDAGFVGSLGGQSIPSPIVGFAPLGNESASSGTSPMSITTTSIPSATVSVAYNATLAATGGTLPYSWSVTAGTLPSGLSLSPAGTISGTPVASATTNVTFEVTDSSTPALSALVSLALSVVSSPQIAGATTLYQQTSLTVSAGSNLYIFGYATGGAYQSQDFGTGTPVSINNADGNKAVEFATTTANQDSFQTGTSYESIGGVGVSGYGSYTDTYGSSSKSGPSGASDVFSVSVPNSLVVVMAMGADEECFSVTTPSGLAIASQTPQGDYAFVIEDGTLGIGTYTASMTTSQCAVGQDPNHAADMIAVFIFTPAGSAPAHAAHAQRNLSDQVWGVPRITGFPDSEGHLRTGVWGYTDHRIQVSAGS